MASQTNSFNPNTPSAMHIDINSCFATIEQQANPNLREKPVVVAAYPTPHGCILTASVEAKKLGIKTGMRVGDGQKLFKNLVVLTPDPPKYRYVHLKMREPLNHYTDKVTPKSIDEFVLDFEDNDKNLLNVSHKIKECIKKKSANT